MNSNKTLSRREIIEAGAAATEELLNRIARKEMLYFTCKTKPDYSVQWFHRLLCSRLDDLSNSKIKKLMVFMPAQHGKSELVSRRLPAFILGKNPMLKVAACSYSADLAAKFNREVQRIIDDNKYREIFPDTCLNTKNTVTDSKGSWLRNSDEFEIVNHGGSYKGVGVMGPLTGNPVDFGIIDDPVKDRHEAQSKTYRERLWDWYNDVFCFRLHNDSRVLLTMTRWHEDDLAGRILKEETGWVVLKLPGLKEDNDNPDDPRDIDEALWPGKHSKEKLLEAKSKSERSFASMIQQRPAAQEGNIFKEAWFKYYIEPPSTCDEILVSFDCTFKDAATSDYVAATAWAKCGAECYLLDCIRGRWGFVDTIKHFQLFCEKWQPRQKLIEDKANGTAIIEVLKDKISGIVPINPKESKAERAEAVSYLYEAGNIYHPETAEWLDDYESELKSFPSAPHDDMVDSTTQALNKLYSTNRTFTGRILL